MSSILVLHYSMHGHIETMAQSVAEGAAEVEGVEVNLRRVPETMSREKLGQIGAKLDDDTPYGAATLGGPDLELSLARFQGRHVAGITHTPHG